MVGFGKGVGGRTFPVCRVLRDSRYFDKNFVITDNRYGFLFDLDRLIGLDDLCLHRLWDFWRHA